MALTQSHNHNLMAHETLEDTFYTPNHQVSCEGSDLGHPRVYLEVEANGEVVCGYCSRTFIHR